MFGAPDGFARERSRSPARQQNANRGGDWFCPACHDHQFAKNACCRNCGASKPADPSACGPPDAATFLKDHIIDDQVLLRFLSLTPEQQLVVIMRGTLSGARDPSAVLSSRITQVLQGKMTASNPMPRASNQMMGGQSDPNQMMQMMMMQMMQMAGGGQATGGMPDMGGKGGPIVPRNGDWYCQQCGDHQFAKNALCRSCGASRPTDGSESIPPSPEKFLAMHPGLEEHAIAKFLALDLESQTIVIKRGSLIGSRDASNPNAVLLGRIKTVQQRASSGMMGMGGGMGGGMSMGGGMGMGGGGNSIQPSANDWYCPNCYDLQFRNNDVCRICGTSREFGVKDISALDPNTFLAGHHIEPQALEQFRNLPDEQKKVVMSGGSLHGARDPTAVLINRMAKARQGHGGGALFSSGKGAQQNQGMDMQMMQQMQQMMMQMMQQSAQPQQPQQQMALTNQPQQQMGGQLDMMQQAQMQLQQQAQMQQQQQMQQMQQQQMMGFSGVPQ